MKNTSTIQNKLVKRAALFYILYKIYILLNQVSQQISVIPDLIKDSWILTAALHRGNVTLHTREMSEKGKDCLLLQRWS